MYIMQVSTPVDPLVLLAVIGLALVLILFAHKFKMGIYNLFAAGVFVWLMFEFSSIPALMIIFIGLAIFQMWMAFWGWRK